MAKRVLSFQKDLRLMTYRLFERFCVVTTTHLIQEHCTAQSTEV